MIFSGIFFIFIFLPIAVLIYYILPCKYRNLWLFLFSLVFYAWGEPSYVFLMMFMILFNYSFGLLLEKFSSQLKIKKTILIFSVVINLGILIFFKYTQLFINSVQSIFKLNLPDLAIVLPIGISFYIFESLSYLVDIYRGEAMAQRNLINFGTYLSFFPHLIAGPIIQYKFMEKQLTDRKETLAKFASGSQRFLTGLFKKVLLANNLGQLADKIQFYGNPSALSAWIGALAFTFQIYFDFSGYSDMAIGLGEMFGFTLPENFNLPYLSQSATEFWRRWHITLGNWFKEYLYFPLGGNRCSAYKNIRNLIIVWVLTGLWHGASWNFAVWGGYWGVLIIVEKYFLKRHFCRIPNFIKWLYAFVAAVIGWVLFSYQNLGEAGRMVAAMFGGAAGYDRLGIYSLCTYWPLLLLAAFFSSALPGRIKKITGESKIGKIIWCTGTAVFFVVTLSFLVDNSYNPFLYFRF